MTIRSAITRRTTLAGLSAAAAVAVLPREAAAANPLFQCRFRWQANSIAFWDNRCVQHRAMWDYWPNRRYGNRVTVKGARPV